MFAGGKRRSSNVRIMQLFHELKAQFPTIPDHIITSCVTSHIVSGSIINENLYDLVLAKIGKEQNQMGRPSVQVDTPPFIPSPTIIVNHQFLSEPSNNSERIISISEMNHSDDCGDNINNNSHHQLSEINKKSSDLSVVVAKRPDTLDINNIINKSRDKNDRKLQLSEKCKDVFKLLNSPGLVDKPPRSPLSVKRFGAAKAPRKDSPTHQSSSSAAVLPFNNNNNNNNNNNKKETVSTPTQTTDTLVNNIITPSSIISPSLNLSLNVNYQMGLTQSPPPSSSSSSLSVIKPKCTAKVDLSPTQPWLNPNPSLSDVDFSSPRSFTTVNLTLRPPTSSPQNPIDITSQNSSLTYSTSSFDKENGLQSRLQITVGPGNSGTVSSVRTRPRSYHMGENCTELVNSGKCTSLTNLPSIGSEASDPLLLKQQIRIDRMRIELETGNKRLVIMRQEVKELEKNTRQILVINSTAEELEKQIKMEIKHLTAQCEQLAALFDNDQFYSNIYTGPSGPLLLPQQQRPQRSISFSSRPQQQQQQQFIQRPILDFSEVEGPKWNCSVCTFLNHPYLDKCEQCDMRRVHHQISAAPGDNIHIHVTPRLSSSKNNKKLISVN